MLDLLPMTDCERLKYFFNQWFLFWFYILKERVYFSLSIKKTYFLGPLKKQRRKAGSLRLQREFFFSFHNELQMAERTGFEPAQRLLLPI